MIPGILSYYLHSILTFLGAFEEATYRRKKVFQVGRRVRAAPIRGESKNWKITSEHEVGKIYRVPVVGVEPEIPVDDSRWPELLADLVHGDEGGGLSGGKASDVDAYAGTGFYRETI